MLDLFKKSYENVQPQQVKEMMNDKDVVVIDVRENYEYASGHIKNAKLMPLGSLPSSAASLDKSKKIVVVCASGGRSASASNFLGKQGFKIYNMVGGMMNWPYEVAR